MSPCIYKCPGNPSPNSLQTNALCTQYLNCTKISDNLLDYAVVNFTSEMRTIMPIGIAKDGHIIYGPLKQGGSYYQPCDVDICNGRYINNQYAYVMTNFHPYTVGCFGPGSTPNYA